jgi:UDP-glucose:(heptosyl)LPS alpha-1,3-glucosyltransferase
LPDRPSRPRRLRIALVAHDVHDAGGMERTLAELIRRAHDRVDFVVVSATLAHDLRPVVDWRRVRVPARPFPLKFVLFFLRAPRVLRRVDADLIYTMGAIVPSRADVAHIQFCHAGARAVRFLPPRSLARRINRALTQVVSLLAERWAYRPTRLRMFITVSEGVRAELDEHYPGIPVRIVANGVDRERFSPDERSRELVRAAEGVAPDDVMAFFVGGDWGRKGLDVAIGALAHAVEAGAGAVRLWVVGGGDVQRYQGLARSLGVAERVRFLGRRYDTERFYRAADVFLFPTAYEAFPLVALEAAASGLPLVATPVNGVEELLGDGEAGLLVERDANAMGDALATLALDASRRRGMGQAARRRSEQYTWEAAADGVLAAWDEVVGRRIPA